MIVSCVLLLMVHSAPGLPVLNLDSCQGFGEILETVCFFFFFSQFGCSQFPPDNEVSLTTSVAAISLAGRCLTFPLRHVNLLIHEHTQ